MHLMNEVLKLREKAGLTQAALAKSAGTSQPAIAAYESRRKSPTLATLRRLAEAAGLEMFVDFHPRLTREERRSLFLHEAIARRLVEDPERVLAKARKTLARAAEAHPNASPILEEWRGLLERPVPELVELLLDPAPRARELRHVTPFAGVLSARERTVVYRAFAEAERAA
jgi:transcriptional regulator with XRE-family HTH domain